MMKVSDLFYPEPERWGFRGDPYFWRYLRQLFSNTDMPFDPDMLESVIRKEHLRLSGEKMSLHSKAFFPMFSHGGMTSGGVSGEYWMKTAIPLLRERCEAANHELVSSNI